MNETDLQLTLLTIGLKENLLTPLLGDSNEFVIENIETIADFDDFLSSTPRKNYLAALCGTKLSEIDLFELAQCLKFQFPDQGVFFLTDSNENFTPKELKRNGFDEAYLLPIDEAKFVQTIKDTISDATLVAKTSFRAVSVIDIAADSSLNFDVSLYFPLNDRYVLISNAGDSLDIQRVEKLKKYRINSIYIPKDQLPNFYTYSAKQLALLSSPNKQMSETERKERLGSAIRDLMTSVFDAGNTSIKEGKNIVSNCNTVIKTYIMESRPSDWYKKVLSIMTDEEDTYGHLSRVASFASLLSIGLQIGKPEELASAGLFHDIGMVALPLEMQNKREDEITDDQKALYQTHPEKSIQLIQARKLIIPESVKNAILQHHERWNGSGYPKGLAEARISPEASILAMADQLDNLTCRYEGKKGMSPSAAIAQIKQKKMFNSEFIEKVSRLIVE